MCLCACLSVFLRVCAGLREMMRVCSYLCVLVHVCASCVCVCVCLCMFLLVGSCLWMLVRVFACFCVFLCVRGYLCVCAWACVSVCARTSGRKKWYSIFSSKTQPNNELVCFYIENIFFSSNNFKFSEFLFTNTVRQSTLTVIEGLKRS